MGIVQRRSAIAYDDICKADGGTTGSHQAPLASDYHGSRLIADSVADEIERGIQFRQISMGSVQFLLHLREQDIVLRRVLWRVRAREPDPQAEEE